MQDKVSEKEVLYVKKNRFDPKKKTTNIFLEKLERRIREYYELNNSLKTKTQ